MALPSNLTRTPRPPGSVVLRPQPLQAAGFAPYGTVVEPFDGPASANVFPPFGLRAINHGTTWRRDLLVDLDLHRNGGTPGLGVYSAAARRFPLALVEVECHRLASQTFLPLTGAPFVVVVAPPGPPPAAAELRAFVSDGRQGVVLSAGTWHHGLLAVRAGSFAVIERQGPAGEAQVDCDLSALMPAAWLELGLPLR